MKEIWNKARAIQYWQNHPSVSSPTQDQILQFISTTAPDYVPNLTEVATLNQPTQSSHWLDQPFLLNELQKALYSKKNTAPGPDYISYDILKHFSKSSLVILCRIFNALRSKLQIPDS